MLCTYDKSSDKSYRHAVNTLCGSLVGGVAVLNRILCLLPLSWSLEFV